MDRRNGPDYRGYLDPYAAHFRDDLTAVTGCHRRTTARFGAASPVPVAVWPGFRDLAGYSRPTSVLPWVCRCGRPEAASPAIERGDRYRPRPVRAGACDFSPAALA